MATPYHVYTIEYVAQMLGVSLDLLHELAITMEPEDGVRCVVNEKGESCWAFTDFGIESAAEQLNDPPVCTYLERLLKT
jgi:hypothetical protein